MARKVFVTSDMAHDERLIEVAQTSPEAALLWPWVLTHFDDWGRAEANSLRIKAKLFPMNPLVTVDLVETALNLFAEAGLITLYEHDGKRYMSIPPEKWYKYQTHIRREKRPGKDKLASDYPAPPGQVDESGDSGTPQEPPQTPAGSRGESRGPVPSPSPSLTNDDDDDTHAREASGPSSSGVSTGAGDPEWRQLTTAVFGATFDGYAAECLKQDVEDTSIELVKEAMRRSVKQATTNRLSYYRKIINGWRGKARTLDDVRRLDEAAKPPPRASPRQLSALELAEMARRTKGGQAV